MSALKQRALSKPMQWFFEGMAMLYVAVAVVFVVNPDWPILAVNQAFSHYGWPMVFFPTERFWVSLAVSVPAIRAFLAFSASKHPSESRLCIKALQVSVLIAALMFAWQFLSHKRAPLYALGFFVECLQVLLYGWVHHRLR